VAILAADVEQHDVGTQERRGVDRRTPVGHGRHDFEISRQDGADVPQHLRVIVGDEHCGAVHTPTLRMNRSRRCS